MTKQKRTRSKKTKKGILRFFIFGLTCLSISCLIIFSVSKIWSQIYKKYTEKKELDEKLAKLKEDEENLSIDVKKMQDPEYIARYLREKYFYSKDGEYIIRIPNE